MNLTLKAELFGEFKNRMRPSGCCVVVVREGGQRGGRLGLDHVLLFSHSLVFFQTLWEGIGGVYI